MAITAKLRYLHIAPRKVRLVADLIRGKPVEEAQAILNFSVKKASQPLLKLLKSAVASARSNFQLDEFNLFISKITVDEGPKYKRWRPRSRGQTFGIQKKTSHIKIVLEETKKTAKKVKKIEKPKKEIAAGKEKGLAEEKEGAVKEKKPKFKITKDAFRPKIEKRLKKTFRRKAF